MPALIAYDDSVTPSFLQTTAGSEGDILQRDANGYWVPTSFNAIFQRLLAFMGNLRLRNTDDNDVMNDDGILVIGVEV